MRTRNAFAQFIASVACLGACAALAAPAATPYPKMAPTEQYLMDRDAEVALARSAAPDGVSKAATVLVLTRRGYETAAAGTNGWTCIVDRGWGGMFDHPEFWSTKVRAAACLNPAASRSFLPYDLLRTKLVLAGKSKEEIIGATASAIDRKELPATVEAGALCYMMAKGSYLTDDGPHNMSHVMFYTPDDGTPWGANIDHSPVMGVSYWSASPDSYPQLRSFPRIFVSLIGTGHWADGSPALTM